MIEEVLINSLFQDKGKVLWKLGFLISCGIFGSREIVVFLEGLRAQVESFEI